MGLLRRLARLSPWSVRFVVVQDESELSDAERAELRAEAAFQASLLSVFAPAEGGPYSCPCCGHRTLPERGRYDLCPECSWEDDGQDDHDSHLVRRGPNGGQSLDEARAAYRARGGRPQPHTTPRPPDGP